MTGISGITIISFIIFMTSPGIPGTEIFYSNRPEKIRLIVNNQIETAKYRIITKFALKQ